VPDLPGLLIQLSPVNWVFLTVQVVDNVFWEFIDLSRVKVVSLRLIHIFALKRERQVQVGIFVV
jgi:hypothetical protein